MTLTPQLIAGACLLVGAGMGVAGVYVLAGAGWALLAAGVPLLLAGVTLLRGASEVTRAE